MRVTYVYARNFGSYEDIDFDYKDLGLALVSGPTGAGKSTLQDIVPWVLFGVTSRGGKVDDIRSWANDKDTYGEVHVNLDNGDEVVVTRTRGKVNDLYWKVYSSIHVWEPALNRGKDLTETQKLIEDLLGVAEEVFFVASIHNEFSRSGNFFSSKAKERKELFEILANLQFSSSIECGVMSSKKTITTQLVKLNSESDGLIGRLAQLKKSLQDSTTRAEKWEKDEAAKLEAADKLNDELILHEQAQIDNLSEKHAAWDKSRIEQLNEATKLKKDLDIWLKDNQHLAICDKCGSRDTVFGNNEWLRGGAIKTTEVLIIQVSPFEREIKWIKDKIQKLKDSNKDHTRSFDNPFLSQQHTINCDISNVENDLQSVLDQQLRLEIKLVRLKQLTQLVYDYRASMLNRTIQTIETTTNTYLQRYFDGEIKVSFKIIGVDKLEVSIQKDGFDCPFSRLSRGQSSMLKLCFAVSVMKEAANRTNKFNLLCFDEVLDGLSSDLKIKALGLFQELKMDYEAILFIDHAPELFSHFDKRFNVTLKSDYSILSNNE